MESRITQVFRARLVVPVSQPAIEDGAVTVADGQVRAVGRWCDLAPHLSAVPIDLGEVVILPGLVNPHCHLDYSDMAGKIAPLPSFTAWIKSITALKALWTYADFATSWLNGARMLVRSGTTTVGDIEAVPELLPEVWEATPLRVFSFLELTGVKSRAEPGRILEEAVARIEGLAPGRSRAWLSPHAPYSTTPELLRLTGSLTRDRQWRVTTHVAESAEEFDMFVHGRGPLNDWLARNERDMTDCGGVSPVAHLERQGLLGDNLLAVHANYLEPGDVALLARRGVHVVHCPRSHAYFEHRPFPYHSLRREGVNVCLGTDSLATVRNDGALCGQLDLFAEMRTFRGAFPGASPGEVLELATIHGARALGLSGAVGELSAGSRADLVVIPWSGPLQHAADAITHHQGPVAGTMIDGRWIFSPGEVGP